MDASDIIKALELAKKDLIDEFVEDYILVGFKDLLESGKDPIAETLIVTLPQAITKQIGLQNLLKELMERDFDVGYNQKSCEVGTEIKLKIKLKIKLHYDGES